MKFHSGELAVQKRTGVEYEASRVGQSIHTSIPAVAADFIARQPMMIVGHANSDGRMWASVLTGPLGSFHAVNQHAIEITAAPAASDPLSAVWKDGLSVGALFIELETRRRMRVNGTIELRPGDAMGAVLSAKEVYANCPKYIQARELTSMEDRNNAPASQQSRSSLSESQQAWISSFDTFFIASSNPAGNADASHRGGAPGFVRVASPNKLIFPDYAGNNMFNTLGNLAINPNAGLLWIDFTNGAVLQLTGTASLSWASTDLAQFPGAARLVEFNVSQVLQTDHAVGLHWGNSSASPYNPR